MNAKTEGQKSFLHKFLRSDNMAGYVFAAPFIIGFLGFTIVPMIVSLYYSFTNYSMASSNTDWIGISNYARLFQDSRFINSLRVTLYYVFVSVPLKLIFALFIAYMLTKKAKGVTFYRALYYLPSLIGGSISVALIWKELFSSRGLINHLLVSAGFESISWFGDQRMAMFPIILMSVWQFGSSMIIFAAGLKQIPDTYYEAASLDGANKWQIFSKITIPCLSPIILYNLIMQTIAAFMSFTQVFVITGGGPNDSTNLYSMYMYTQAFRFHDMGYASAMSWFMLVVMSFITFLIFKSSKHWVFSEAGED